MVYRGAFARKAVLYGVLDRVASFSKQHAKKDECIEDLASFVELLNSELLGIF